VPARVPREPWPVWPDGFAAREDDRRAALVLAALAGLTPKRLLPVAHEAGTASACLRLVRRGLLGSDRDTSRALSVDPDVLADRTSACEARFVTWDDVDYPPQLRTIHDPPLGLFVRGRALPELRDAVAVVGSRRCSPLGREIARSIGRGLARSGVSVVSGAARGIDAAAHEGALDVEGPTLAVSGCGIDRAYPAGSRALIERIAFHGTVVSEYPPGVPPHAFRFPARNRIVAGLSRATVVVEGADGSGSLITGEHALEFGREVFAVPGAVNHALAHVPLSLIRDGASMIRGVEDLLADLGLDRPREAAPARLTLAERRGLAALVGPTLPEVVARDLGIGTGDALSLLTELELRGLVRCIGGRFEPTLAAGSVARSG
jgi:DNA processing protein